MTKFLKNNIFKFSISAMLIVAMTTVFSLVRVKEAAKLNPEAILASNTCEKSLHKTSEVEQLPASIKNGLINVQGEDNNFSFHSLEFIDDQNGLVIEDRNTVPKQSSKLLKTQDGGVHWDKTELKDCIINKVKFINKTVGWAVAEPASEAADSKMSTIRILKTEDAGKSWIVQWENKAILTSNNDLWFQDEANGYALISGVLLSTRDGGKQWSSISFGIACFILQHMSFTSAEKGWVIGIVQNANSSNDHIQSTGAKLMVLQTADGGKHWNKQFDKDYTDGPVGSISIDFVNASTGWFLTSDLATWDSELYYTSDSGMNWNKINQINCVRPTPTELYFVTPKIGWIPLNVGAGPISGGLMFTNDGGKTFERIGSENEHGIISTSQVYFTSEKQGWAIGTDPNHGDYIIHTADGGKSWAQIYPKLSPVEDISFVNNDLGFGLGQFMDNGALLETVDGGESWKNIYSFPKTFYPSFISFSDDNNGWTLGTAEENKTAIYKTSDGGKSWAQLQDDLSQIQAINTVYFHIFDLNSGIIAARDVNKISFFTTKDGGRSWKLSGESPAKDATDFSFLSPSSGWIVDTSRQDSYSLEVRQTTNTETWQSISVAGSNMWPYSIDFISRDKGWIVVQEPPFKQDSIIKLLFTSDGGKTWSTRQFPKTFKFDTVRNQIPLQFTDENHAWLLTISGLLLTKDGGNTWSFIN